MKNSVLPRLLTFFPKTLRRHRVIKWIVQLFPRLKVATFKFNQSAFIVTDLTDAAARQVLITESFEPEFFSIAESFLFPNSAIFDIGANNGFCTFGLAAGRKPGENISFHLFEANKHLCDMLNMSSKLYSDQASIVINACVTDQPGFSTLKIDDEHWGGSYITPMSEGQKVRNVVLDDYLRESQIGPVSFLKMDIEGYELNAIKGLEASIRMGKIGSMYIECSSENLRRQGQDTEALFGLLRQFGCRLFWCKEPDFEKGHAKNAREIFPTAGKAAVRLAPIVEFPSDYQTDIIAIPINGPHKNVINSFDGKI